LKNDNRNNFEALISTPKLSDFLLDLHRSLAHQDLSTSLSKRSLNSGYRKIAIKNLDPNTEVIRF